MVRQHGRHDPIRPRAIYKALDVGLMALEAMFRALEILQQEPFEITESIEDQCGDLAGEALFLLLFFHMMKQFEQRLAFDAA